MYGSHGQKRLMLPEILRKRGNKPQPQELMMFVQPHQT